MNRIQGFIICIAFFVHFPLINVYGQSEDSLLSGNKSLSYILNAQKYFNNNETDKIRASFEDFFIEMEKHPKIYPVDDWIDLTFSLSASIYGSAQYALLTEILEPISKIKHQINDDRYFYEMGRLLNLLALSQKKQGFLAESIDIYLIALEYFNQSESLPPRVLPGMYINIGNAYRSLGELGEVDIYYNEALRQIDKQLEDPSLDIKDRAFFSSQKSTTLNSIGLRFQALGKHDDALKAFQESMDLSKKWDTTKLPMINNNMGVSYRAKNDTLNALSHFKSATAVYQTKELDNSWVKYTLNYSNWLMKLDSMDVEKAYSLTNQAITEGPKIQDVTESQMATAYFQLGTMQSEKSKYKSAIVNTDRGLCLLTGKPERSNYSTDPPEIVLSNSPNKVIEGIKFRARIFKDWGTADNDTLKYFISLENYQLAITCIDSLRNILDEEESKTNLSRLAKETYAEKLDVLWNILPSSNYSDIADEALKSIESGKAASLWDMLQISEKRNLSLPPEIIAQEKQLKREIADFDNRILETDISGGINQDSLQSIKFLKERQLDSLNNYVNDNFPDLENTQQKNNSFAPYKIRAMLKDDQVMIHYFFSETMLHQVFMSPDSTIYRAIPNANQLREQILAFSKMLKLTKYDYSTTDVKNYQALGWELYRKLIHPFDKLIENKKIIILPDEFLAMIPFETLITSETYQLNSDFRNQQYFILKNQVSYSYNAMLWAFKKDKQKLDQRSILAMAPSYGIEGMKSDSIWKIWESMLPELTGTLKEVKLIEDNYNAKTYIKTRATEKHFKDMAGNFNILHLAMHSIMDETKPDNSFLAFTPFADKSENGRLYANEIRNLNLNASLTILSACNSGTGELIEGEGVLSLSRTFIMAGSSSVIMTLWSVDDQTSMQLIDKLYRDLELGMSVAEALRSSKRYFILNANKLYAHPYFWSGFVQLGKDTNIDIKKKSMRWPWYAGGVILLALILLFVIPQNTKSRSED